ncbi:MAG: hypothetical protein ACYTF7_03225 [Planctomycetota bacterium]
MHEQNPNISDARSHAIDAIAWSTLLARWIEWARAAVALPDDAHGSSWKASLPHLIALQAITHALDELPSVVAADRPLALERAALTIRESCKALHNCWAGEPMPISITVFIDEAHHTLARAQTLGPVFHVELSDWIAPDPTHWARALIERGFTGNASAVLPGTLLSPGAPCAWCSDTTTEIPAIPGCAPPKLLARPQIYREIDENDAIRDVLSDFSAEPLPGMPLMVRLIENGQLVYEFDQNATHRWIERQAEALPQGAPTLVVSSS